MAEKSHSKSELGWAVALAGSFVVAALVGIELTDNL